MNLERRTRVLVAAALVALAAPSAAHAFYCTAPGSDYTGCLPPVLQSVEPNSFSFVFKLPDSASILPVVVALYDDQHPDTDSPLSCANIASNLDCQYGMGDDHACYQKVDSSIFNVAIQPNTKYAYNVNVGGGICMHPTSGYTIAGGEWFNSRRPVHTPAAKPGAISFAIIGDTRDGGQDDCSNGVAQATYGDIQKGTNCGGSDAQRKLFAQAVASTSLDFIIHTGDISLNSDLDETFKFWRDIGTVWQDISTTFAYGNHEFGNEEFGTHTETFAYDMVSIPATPPGYPATTGSTYYAQNFGNVHVVYLNSQSCVLEAYNAGADCPGTSTAGTPARPVSTADDATACGCYGYSKTQRDWLERDLKYANGDSAIDFILVVDHKPFWSNGSDAYSLASGEAPPTATGAWTNTLAREEYALHDGGATNLSPGGGYAKSNDGSSWAYGAMKPLDAILQMYNVDLFISSHAHYYERLADTRYRVTLKDANGNAYKDALPHYIIGGGGSPEQAYECPQASVPEGTLGPRCLAKSAASPHSFLPSGINFEYGTDGSFYFGNGVVDNSAHTLAVYGIMIDDEDGSEELIDWQQVTSRKSQIRGGAMPAGFNGCNLVYDKSTSPPLGFGSSSGSPNHLPATQTNVNCVVH